MVTISIATKSAYLLNFELYKSTYDKGGSSKQSACKTKVNYSNKFQNFRKWLLTDGHSLQGPVKELDFGEKRIDDVLKYRNHQNNQQWIDDLNLVRFNSESAQLTIHSCRLEGPSRGLLVE